MSQWDLRSGRKGCFMPDLIWAELRSFPVPFLMFRISQQGLREPRSVYSDGVMTCIVDMGRETTVVIHWHMDCHRDGTLNNSPPWMFQRIPVPEIGKQILPSCFHLGGLISTTWISSDVGSDSWQNLCYLKCDPRSDINRQRHLNEILPFSSHLTGNPVRLSNGVASDRSTERGRILWFW